MNINRNGRSYANLTMPVALGISSQGVQSSYTAILGGSRNFISSATQGVSQHWPDGELLEQLTKFRDTELDELSFYFIEEVHFPVQHEPDSAVVMRLFDKHTTCTGKEFKDTVRNYMERVGSYHVPENPFLAFCKGRLVVITVLVNCVNFLITVRPIGEESSLNYDTEASAVATEMLLEVFSKYTPEQAAQALMHKRMKDLPRARSVLEAILQGITLTGAEE